MTLTKKLLLAAATAAALSGMPIAQASPHWSIGINIGPPPLRYEPVPVPRAGYVWVPGYWDWRGQRHVWISGHYLREKRHQHYSPSYWSERGGRWYHAPGRWDADRDGTPDRYDRHPHNPRRR
ncbi:MAG: YXWGXW repeat-containing protein [Betaproteobacteria bacterium]|nr:YXWGXW repeat-containing protein [Betaproteobacteria bacterium]